MLPNFNVINWILCVGLVCLGPSVTCLGSSVTCLGNKKAPGFYARGAIICKFNPNNMRALSGFLWTSKR